MSKKNFINQSHIEGYVYEHKLELKVSGATSKNPGTEFISGTVSIATDNAMLNVIPVHFTYVTAVTAKGSPNATFNTLKAIIDGKIGTVMTDGAENAGMLRIDSALALNDYYSNRNGTEELVSLTRNEGGFVHTTNELNPESGRSTFDVDMVISKITRAEADPDRNTPEKMTISGYIFDFRKSVLPYSFTVLHPGAMSYFESLEPTSKHPVFTHLKGVQVNQSITRTITEASAFGEPMVREVKSSNRDMIVNWAAPETYEWDSEETILASELAEMLANREIYLADIKKRADDYRASKNAGASAFNTAAANAKPGATPAYNF